MDEYRDESAGPGLGMIVGILIGALVVLALLWFVWIGPTYYPATTTVIVPAQPAEQPVQPPAEAPVVVPAPDVNVQQGSPQGGTGGTGGTGGSVTTTP